ncbi:MAG: FAD-binding oxidoreductase [Bacteroidota bacterium]
MNLTYWEQTAFFPPCDIAIVGGGLVGLSTAISLKEKAPYLNVVVLERGNLPSGASTRNAGFACFGSLTEILADIHSMGEEAAVSLIEMRIKGLEMLRARLGDSAIQYQHLGGFEIFLDEDETFHACLEAMPRINRAVAGWTGMANCYELADARIPELGLRSVKHLIVNHAEGQLHPGFMTQRLQELAQRKGIRLTSGQSVSEITSEKGRFTLQLENGANIRANKVVLANNAFARQFLPELPVIAVRNQVLLSEPIPGLSLKGCFHFHEGYVYARNVGTRLLIGGGRHLDPQGEQTADFGAHPEIREYLETFAKKHLCDHPNLSFSTQWSGILSSGPEKRPIVQEVEPGLFVAVRLSGMGVAIGSLIGEEVSERVL